MVKQGVHRYGIAKVILPEEFHNQNQLPLGDLPKVEVLEQRIDQSAPGVCNMMTRPKKKNSRFYLSYNEYFDLVKPNMIVKPPRTK